MRKTIIKSLILLSAIFQIAMAQNTERSMNQDSTNLVPFGMATLPTNQTHTSTYSTVMGACGADNGKTLSSAPTNLCSAGTPSTVYTNGNSFAWSCTGNYGTASTASCGAAFIPSTGTVNVAITFYEQCTGTQGRGGPVRLVVGTRTVPVSYKITGTTARYTGTSGSYVGFYGNAIGIEAMSIINFSISGKPPGITFPSFSVVANDGCSG